MPAALRTLGDAAPDRTRGLDVAGRLQPLSHVLLHRRGGRQYARAAGIEQLRIDVPRRAMHAQVRDRKLANLGAGLLRGAGAALSC